MEPQLHHRRQGTIQNTKERKEYIMRKFKINDKALFSDEQWVVTNRPIKDSRRRSYYEIKLTDGQFSETELIRSDRLIKLS